jgi:hypothetical protein
MLQASDATFVSKIHSKFGGKHGDDSSAHPHYRKLVHVDFVVYEVDRYFEGPGCSSLIGRLHAMHMHTHMQVQKPDTFVVVHFAGAVEYTSKGILEKSKVCALENARAETRTWKCVRGSV